MFNVNIFLGVKKLARALAGSRFDFSIRLTGVRRGSLNEFARIKCEMLSLAATRIAIDQSKDSIQFIYQEGGTLSLNK